MSGFHLFPFRTEKLSLITPMVLRTSGRVGCRRLYKALQLNCWGAFVVYILYVSYLRQLGLKFVHSPFSKATLFIFDNSNARLELLMIPFLVWAAILMERLKIAPRAYMHLRLVTSLNYWHRNSTRIIYMLLAVSSRFTVEKYAKFFLIYSFFTKRKFIVHYFEKF